VIPSTVVFAAHDAHPDLSKLTLCDPDSRPAFDRWQRCRCWSEGQRFGSDFSTGWTQRWRAKSISLSPFIGHCPIKTEIENLRYPLIAPLVGFVFPVESGGTQELKAARLPAAGGSLTGVFSAQPP
jgi:hypothetical protein